MRDMPVPTRPSVPAAAPRPRAAHDPQSAPASATGAHDPHTTGARGELRVLREAIERVDDELVTLIAERQSLALRVGETKRAAGLAIADPAREAGVVRRAGERAREVGLPPDAVRELFRRLIAFSREQQLR